MKKLLIIARKYSPVYSKRLGGSIESLIRLLIEENERRKGFLITVYSPKINNEHDSNQFKLTKFRIIDKDSFRYKLSLIVNGIKKISKRDNRNEAYVNFIVDDLKKRGEQNEFDAIIFENMQNDLVGFRGKLNTKSKIILHLHNDYINVDDPKTSGKIGESVDEIWAVSQFAKDRIRAILPNIRVKVIPNAIEEIDARNNSIEDEKQLEDIKGKIAKKTTLLYVGRISEEKGVFDVIEAIKGREDVTLLLVGELEGYAKKYFSKKHKTENEKKNLFYLGKMNKNEIKNYQKLADIQIIPSKCNETFGLTLLEAMSAQKKIVATTSGALKEVGNESVIYISPNSITKDFVGAMEKANRITINPKTYADRVTKYTSALFYQSIKSALMAEMGEGRCNER